MKTTIVLFAIVLIAIERAGALECHYCDPFSKDNKCRAGEEEQETCDDTSGWCEVEFTDGVATTKLCSDIEALPSDYTAHGPALQCKQSDNLLHCFCRGDNCNKAGTYPDNGRGSGFWVGVVVGPLLAILAAIGLGALYFRYKSTGR